MKKIISFVLLVVALCGCANHPDSDKPVLAVSIPPQARILAELADSSFSVVSVIRPGTNSETYDPTLGERMRLANARAFFITGVLPFEKTLVSGLPDSVKIIDTSAGIVPISDTHSHHHGSDPGSRTAIPDPHISTSYTNAILMAENFASALAEIDPERSSLYRERLAGFTARIEAARTDAARRLRESGAHAFAVWHPSLSYYARDFGLHQIAVGQESKEISISSLSSIVNEARADSVRVFFFQKEYDSRQAESINTAIGSRLITIDPLAQDWEAQLKIITDALTADN